MTSPCDPTSGQYSDRSGEGSVATYDIRIDPMRFSFCSPACDEDACWEKDGSGYQWRYDLGQ